MKKILMALTMLGMVHYSANAQSKHHSRYNENYKVCKYDGGYGVCNDENAPLSSMNTTTENDNSVAVENSAPCNTTSSSLEMNNVNAYEGHYRRHNILVSYDEMNNPYEGLPSKQNDGVRKNEERNLNTNQTQMVLPANDGSQLK